RTETLQFRGPGLFALANESHRVLGVPGPRRHMSLRLDPSRRDRPGDAIRLLPEDTREIIGTAFGRSLGADLFELGNDLRVLHDHADLGRDGVAGISCRWTARPLGTKRLDVNSLSDKHPPAFARIFALERHDT